MSRRRRKQRVPGEPPVFRVYDEATLAVLGYSIKRLSFDSVSETVSASGKFAVRLDKDASIIGWVQCHTEALRRWSATLCELILFDVRMKPMPPRNRQEFTRKVRREIIDRATIVTEIRSGATLSKSVFLRYDCVPRCEKCCAPCLVGKFEIDHIVADAFRQDQRAPLTATDGQLLCIPCHKAKSAVDKREIARATRLSDKASGVIRPAGKIRSRGFQKREKPVPSDRLERVVKTPSPYTYMTFEEARERQKFIDAGTDPLTNMILERDRGFLSVNEVRATKRLPPLSDQDPFNETSEVVESAPLPEWPQRNLDIEDEDE